MNFWKKLPQPFTILAPMDGVTDWAFRELITTSLPRPDVFFTEFVAAEAIIHNPKKMAETKLKFSPSHHPIVAQIWGTNPDKIAAGTKFVEELGFDGIDLNMGCPVKDVVKVGGGAALINNPNLAVELIQAAKTIGLPVSIKTRLGFDPVLLKQDLAAFTLHARTAKQMSTGLADWSEIKKLVDLRNRMAANTLIIGNGDVKDYFDGANKSKTFGVDGFMIGRGILHNPWVFDKTESIKNKAERITLALKHIGLVNRSDAIKKYLKIYISNFVGTAELRQKLMESTTLPEMVELLRGQFVR